MNNSQGRRGTDVHRVIDLPFTDLSERLDEGMREIGQREMAVTPTMSRFQWMQSVVRQLENTNDRTSIVVVGYKDVPWSQRERGDRNYPAADFLDLAEDLLDFEPLLGRTFSDSALAVLKGLEAIYAARWGVEFTSLLCYLAGEKKLTAPPKPSAQKKNQRRKKKTSLPKPSARHRRVSRVLSDGYDLANDINTFLAKHREKRSDLTVFCVDGLQASQLSHMRLQASLGSIGTQLLDCREKGKRKAIGLLDRLSRFIVIAGKDVTEITGPADVARETQRMFQLTRRAKEISETT